MAACSRNNNSTTYEQTESRQAKALLQGTWMDEETEETSFVVKGDTIYYADSTSLPALFRVVGDSLVIGSTDNKYAIVKQTEHIFWFVNQNGDIVKLVKNDNPTDNGIHKAARVLTYSEVVKTDSVVNYNGQRYHWYIAINPTKYKVTKRSYNDDGVEVENVYYDNIMHISVFNGARKIYSSDFRKQMYGKMVPAKFLKESVLANMDYDHIDSEGLHFNATICVPDGAICHMITTTISFSGKMTMKLMEY